MLPLPLAGIRVLDLTTVWAGPYATRLLGDMGAEVLKLEGPSLWDALRDIHNLPDDPAAYDKCAFFNHLNRNKFGFVLDLATAEGRDLCLRLVRTCDAVIENYRPDVMGKLGLDYDDLRAVKPDIILISMPGHGKDGPEADQGAYGTNVEQVAGLASLQGYPDRGVHRSGVAYGDPISGVFAAAALVVALFQRRETGRGQYVEVAEREALTAMIGEQVLAYQLTGVVPGPRGNGDTSMAPHGVYRCAGEDDWLALAVENDAQFAALCGAIGRPELARDPRFADVVSRYRHRDELDAPIGAWSALLLSSEAAALLAAAGVPAAPVVVPGALLDNPHLSARGLFELVAHRRAGVWPVDGPVWRLSRTPASIRLPAPSFGEHNRYVFGDLLGLSDDQAADLAKAGVTSDAPRPGGRTASDRRIE
jgi:crotonobetainyl-CoA:carnitine CoA-transferase CaiB-like acyl-CoA transferase